MAALSHIAQWLFIYLIVVPLAYSAVRSDDGRRFILTGFLSAIVVIAVYGIYEVVFTQRNRYTSIYGSPQTLGFQIAVLFPYLLVTLRTAWDEISPRILKFLVVLFIVTLTGAMFWLLIYSLSRTGVLATLLGMAAFFILDGIAIKNPGEFRKRVIPSAILAVSLVAALVSMSRDTVIVERVIARVAMTLEPESEEVTDRTDVWKEALTQIDQSYYLVGVGPDNYQNISRFQQRPHNVFLLFLTEGGAVALIAFTAMLAYFFMKAIPPLVFHRRSPSFSRTFLAGSASSMIAYMVIAMLNTQSLDRIYWFVFAVGLASAAELRFGSKTAVR